MSERLRIRLLGDDDWDAVVALEHDAYAADGLSEGREALQSRARSSPDTCYVLEQQGVLRGYLLSLPYPPLRCPGLARPEEVAFESANRTPPGWWATTRWSGSRSPPTPGCPPRPVTGSPGTSSPGSAPTSRGTRGSTNG
ncbi:hypothetical protein [Kitasatospora sp. NPDC017646]|uniref:hypothetical protein n=1 Tax=Kitasatospora sp. NPDC017646 TaxID=3364024 RepID=UPI0037942315